MYLKAIIKIFRSGFLGFMLAIELSQRDVFIVFKHTMESGPRTLKRMLIADSYRTTRKEE